MTARSLPRPTAGKDTGSVTVPAQGEAVTVAADDDTDEVFRTMTEHQVRRLPVIDGNQLVGMTSQADVAKSLYNPQVGQLIDALSSS